MGSNWQRYCNGFTLSRQQLRKICLKLLFHATPMTRRKYNRQSRIKTLPQKLSSSGCCCRNLQRDKRRRIWTQTSAELTAVPSTPRSPGAEPRYRRSCLRRRLQLPSPPTAPHRQNTRPHCITQRQRQQLQIMPPCHGRLAQYITWRC